ncbi:Rmf/CrpP family protein, partial [Methylobacterium sp. WL30]|uniref:ribosome modulation factor n=1 Tax=Methylobacterium sp. WL30 TaxID=2603895 RepID=UPI0032B290DC
AMPHYHFNVDDGARTSDHEGMFLADIGAARRQAVTIAGALLEADADLQRGVIAMAQTRHLNFYSDPVEEGAQARIHGRPKDACPYPHNSEERVSWLEGYDGTPRDDAPDWHLGSAIRAP